MRLAPSSENIALYYCYLYLDSTWNLRNQKNNNNKFEIIFHDENLILYKKIENQHCLSPINFQIRKNPKYTYETESFKITWSYHLSLSCTFFIVYNVVYISDIVRSRLSTIFDECVSNKQTLYCAGHTSSLLQHFFSLLCAVRLKQ